MSDGARVMWMRGGTSKGGFFLKEDLPDEPARRDALLLAVMGSPDPRQIDGMGGGDPLTSKVAIVSRSARPGMDIDYCFLQVFIDEAIVSGTQNCGNMLAGVGPFAIERGLVSAANGETRLAIHMSNSGQSAIATVRTPGGAVTYAGEARIDGVPGTHAPVTLEFQDIAGSMCGALLPTGNPADMIEGVRCTLIDNGMPCIIYKASDVGLSGYETREALDADRAISAKIEKIRSAAGPLMNLGDVAGKTIPKHVLVAPPRNRGAVTVRSFIPRRTHASIGIFAAITTATACLIEDSPAAEVANVPDNDTLTLTIEHPTGEMSCILKLDDQSVVSSAGIVTTARKLMDGTVFG